MTAVEFLSTVLEAGLFDRSVLLKRNDFVKTAGSVDSDIYFVETGSLRVFMMDNDQERNIRFGYQSNIVVSLDSFLSGKPSDLYIQALKKTRLRVLDKKSFFEFVDGDARHLKAWSMLLEDLVLQQMDREKDILTASPKERYLRVLRRSPQLFQEISNRHIANYLRMTPETLSRLKKS